MHLRKVISFLNENIFFSFQGKITNKFLFFNCETWYVESMFQMLKTEAFNFFFFLLYQVHLTFCTEISGTNAAIWKLEIYEKYVFGFRSFRFRIKNYAKTSVFQKENSNFKMK